ncbi:hypothetical protein [Microlunatus flavus]|uniref:Uncharacterized protein n=1 Tax=Microlunatus flavus TaxID=1036181 RepID=A0A1H9KVL6_9ACTN|nr:hypothetical protein [Microlunatus flavus]SER03196.1 hypothetical protein SAMN05421756_10838 [Microlunatus flavus]
MGNRPRARNAPVPVRVRPPRRGLGVLLLVLGVVVFALLRGVDALAPEPTPSDVYTEHVVLVGVPGRSALTDADRTVLGAHLEDAQTGTVNTRARYVGSCAAASWTTLGAGRRAAVDDLCAPAVAPAGAGARVTDWDARLAAAAARRGDARLGTLAGSVPGCVAAVGPGAALAAANSDGSVASYTDAAAFVAGGEKLSCPVTLVDAGDASDAVITALAARDDVTLLVSGMGPAAGSDDPAMGVFYRIGTTLPGFVTSASTRREGIVTLTDVTRELVDVGRGSSAAVATIDGSPLEVYPADLSLPVVEAQVREVAALSDASVTGYLSLAAGGTLLALLALVGVWRRWWLLPERVLTLGSVLLAGMMLTGAVPWARSGSPGLAVGVAVWSVITVLTFLALGLSRLLRVPPPVAGALVSAVAFTVDAALGGPFEPGSLLNSRPVFGLRWYGFGNVTFAAYAAAVLVVAGWVAHRLLQARRRRAAVVAVGVIGGVMALCEGWPSMGSDFGGIIGMVPAVVWFCLALSGARITWLRALLVGAAGVVAVAAVSVADWSRGPDRRSHLGNFVQRVLDGDAVDVVSRKAVASAETILSVQGVVSVVVGVALWWVMLRWAVPRLQGRFTTLRPTLVAILLMAVVGTLANDGGIGVWQPATAYATTVVGCLWAASLRAGRRSGSSPSPLRRGTPRA